MTILALLTVVITIVVAMLIMLRLSRSESYRVWLRMFTVVALGVIVLFVGWLFFMLVWVGPFMRE